MQGPILVASWLLASMVAAVSGKGVGGETSIYFIGNSVTDTVSYDRFARLASGRGEEVEIGRHTIPGAPLSWIWEHPEGGVFTKKHGPFLEALADDKWDVVSLQPFDRQLEGSDDSDTEVGSRMIREAVKGSSGASARILVYSRWPRRDSDTADTFYGRDFVGQWERPYTNPSWDGGNETRAYFEGVLAAWRSRFPEVQIDLVPVGDVLAQLAKKIHAGQLPGIASITELYSDTIHFYDDRPVGNVGSYVVALTFYSTIFGRSPVGDTTYVEWGIRDAALAGELQTAVWEVVSEHPAAGILKF